MKTEEEALACRAHEVKWEGDQGPVQLTRGGPCGGEGARPQVLLKEDMAGGGLPEKVAALLP